MTTRGARISRRGDTTLVGERGQTAGRRSPNASRPVLAVHRRQARREQRRREDAEDNAIIAARLADPSETPIPWEQAKRTLGL